MTNNDVKQCSARSIGRLIDILHRHIMVYLDKRLKPFRINSANVKILNILYRTKDTYIKQNTLAEFFMIHKCNVTRSIEKLEKEGFIRRWKDKEDGRFYNIKLTDKAIKLRDEIMKILKSTTYILNNGMNEEENKNIIRILNHMINNIIRNEK